MKPSVLPIVCSFALTAMATTGLGYWWSLRQFVAEFHLELPAAAVPEAPIIPAPNIPARSAVALQNAPAPAAPAAHPADAVVPGQQKFYEALLAKMEGIQTQNRDLLDQLAETNRDLMRLEFRVDTHSESFRPLPVSQDRPFTTLNSEPGVLPPRAEPVVFPNPSDE